MTWEKLARWRWRVFPTQAPRRTVKTRGLRFTLRCSNWVTHYRWQTYNVKEPETLDWIDRWVRDGDTLFDIGANIGVYAIYAALRHPRSRVIALEPEYANLALLKENLMDNGLGERVAVYSIAVGDRSGPSYLHLQDVTPGSALHTVSPEAITMTRTRHPVVWREGIYALTLDEFCHATGLQPNGLKIDVDGTEPEVLAGAAETLRSPSLRSVLIEIPRETPARQACEQQLREAGFHGAWRDPLAKTQNEVWVREAS